MSSIFQSPVVKTTACLVIDPAQTKYRENAIQVSGDKISVFIVVPELDRVSSLRQHLEFASRTFNFLNTVPKHRKNADLLKTLSLGEPLEQKCLRISFSAKNPNDYAVELDTVKRLELRTREDLDFQDPEIALLSQTLRVLERNINQETLSGFSLPDNLSEFDRLFAIAHCQAYHLGSQFCTNHQIPHIYHCSAEDHHIRHFDKGESSDGVAMAYLSGPLKKYTGYLNLVQLRHFCKTGGTLFKEYDLQDIVSGMNAIAEDRFSDDRKTVIQKAVEQMVAGGLYIQPDTFRQRMPILEDHVVHSAPRPQDAWKLLMSPASTTELKLAILSHCANNPKYSESLLGELNKRPVIWGKVYSVKESLDLKNHKLYLTLNSKDKISTVRTKKNYEVDYDNYFKERHILHNQVIQEICQVFSGVTDVNEGHLPYAVSSYLKMEELLEFCGNVLTEAMERANIEFDLEEWSGANYFFYRTTFVSPEGASYSYETSPLSRAQAENKRHSLLEVFNYIHFKLEDMGVSMDFPEAIFREDYTQEQRESGIDLDMISYRYDKKGNLYADYRLRLLKNAGVKVTRKFLRAKATPGELENYKAAEIPKVFHNHLTRLLSPEASQEI